MSGNRLSGKTVEIGGWMTSPAPRRPRGESSFPGPITRTLVPGRKIDRYQLLCLLGQGGMASIWAAQPHGNQHADGLVAIKTIRPEYAHDARFRAMFMDEGRIASRIEHTNVTRILDLGEEGDLLYLVMEWVNGDSLSQLRRRLDEQGVELPLGILLRILADICGGLHAVHELCDANGSPLSVIHRDVSPENILVDAEGVAKLIDFGVAKARDRAAEETKTGILKGKLTYMAPEQALKGQADRRIDVWAVGALLYKFLSGRAPFQGDSQVATLCLIVSGKDPPPLPRSVHPAVAAVVERALRHDPDERYSTAAELQSALMVAMVDARVPTTSSDVAAFVSIHMAERIAARRDAVAQAMRMVAEAEKDPEQAAILARSCIRRLGGLGGASEISETQREADTKVARPDVEDRALASGPIRSLAARVRVLGVIGAIAGAAAGFFVWRGHHQRALGMASAPAAIHALATAAAAPVHEAPPALPQATPPPVITIQPDPVSVDPSASPLVAASSKGKLRRPPKGSKILSTSTPSGAVETAVRPRRKQNGPRGARPVHSSSATAAGATAAPAMSTAANPIDLQIVGKVD